MCTKLYFIQYFLGIFHFVIASDFHMPAIVRQQDVPLSIELKRAALRGCSYLVKKCINSGVNINATEFVNTPIFPEMNGWNAVSAFSAIHIASIMGQIDAVNILIKEGADLNIVSGPYNFTALHSVMAILRAQSHTSKRKAWFRYPASLVRRFWEM